MRSKLVGLSRPGCRGRFPIPRPNGPTHGLPDGQRKASVESGIGPLGLGDCAPSGTQACDAGSSFHKKAATSVFGLGYRVAPRCSWKSLPQTTPQTARIVHLRYPRANTWKTVGSAACHSAAHHLLLLPLEIDAAWPKSQSSCEKSQLPGRVGEKRINQSADV